MDEKQFSEIVAVSLTIAEKSKVGLLREMSKKIVRELSSASSGVFIIAGVRGTGKTTLLAELYAIEEKALFINAEIVLKYGVDLLDLLHYASAKGYTTLLIDEIHVLSTWEKNMKIWFDETRGKIILTGSSALALKVKGSELSRRARSFELKPLSFREYLQFKTKKEFPVVTLKDLLNPVKRKELEKAVAPYAHYFKTYCQFEALPSAYFEQNKEVYPNILERTVRYDLLSLREVDALYIENTLRAIKVIASSSPGELSYSGLASSLGVGIKLAKQIVSSLQQTGLVYLIPPAGTGKKAIRKEEKILLPLSFRAALCAYFNLPFSSGSLREDFFVQHVGKCFYFKTGRERRTPDFVVDGIIFEVGGPSKDYAQIKKTEKAYLVKEIITSSENEISLYSFGFLY